MPKQQQQQQQRCTKRVIFAGKTFHSEFSNERIIVNDATTTATATASTNNAAVIVNSQRLCHGGGLKNLTRSRSAGAALKGDYLAPLLPHAVMMSAPASA